jgi:hypothetical protein
LLAIDKVLTDSKTARRFELVFCLSNCKTLARVVHEHVRLFNKWLELAFESRARVICGIPDVPPRKFYHFCAVLSATMAEAKLDFFFPFFLFFFQPFSGLTSRG